MGGEERERADEKEKVEPRSKIQGDAAALASVAPIIAAGAGDPAAVRWIGGAVSRRVRRVVWRL